MNNKGNHLIVDIYNIGEEKLKDIKSAKKLLKDLSEKIGARSIGKPVVKKITSINSLNWGISGFILLCESHIALHTWPENNYAAMDIYHCKNFNKDKINKTVYYLKKYGGSDKIKIKILIRG